jgi:ATP-dependent RNA helicase DeaD
LISITNTENKSTAGRSKTSFNYGVELTTFEEMGLNEPLIRVLKSLNINTPTEVQEKAVPLLMSDKDLIVKSKTGSGKTLAFLIPMLNKAYAGKHHTTLVLAPTRELALQTSSVAQKLKPRDYGIATIYGGASMNIQIDALARNPRLIIGTPGRIIDLMKRNALHLDVVKTIVIDEADTMLDMGFIEDVEYILTSAPRTRQTILLSATMPEKIIGISRNFMTNPTLLKIGDEDEVTVRKIKHFYFVADGARKLEALLAYINTHNPKKVIVFLRTKHEADLIHNFLKSQNLDAVLMHGGLTQSKREHSLHGFRKGVRFLIATNVAARGIDVDDISDIINFDIPEDPLIYVHRVGRSARMGKEGKAFSLIGNRQRNMIEDIQYMAKIKMEPIRLETFQYKELVSKFLAENRGRRFRDSDNERPGGFRGHGSGRPTFHREGSSGGYRDRRGGGGGYGGGHRGNRYGGKRDNRENRDTSRRFRPFH